MSTPTLPPPIPLGLLVRSLHAIHPTLILDCQAQWDEQGRIVVTLPDRALIFRPVTREEVDAFYGSGRIAEFRSAWAISDGRVAFEQTGVWVFHRADPGITDRLARVLADRVLEQMRAEAAAA